MKRGTLLEYNVIRTEYADERIQDKLEYIKRSFRNEQAYQHLESEIVKVEESLSKKAWQNRSYYDEEGEEYKYAYVAVGEGYYLLYQIEGNAVFVLDCLHKRELRDYI